MTESGSLCGVIAGSVFVVGLKHGRGRNDDMSASMNAYMKCSELLDWFNAEFGGQMCSDLTGGVDFRDPEQVSEIRKVIKGMSGERTVILSSHILSEVSMICSKVIIMDRGSVIAVDTPENLGNLLQEKVVTNVRIEGAPERVEEALKNIAGVCKVEAREKISETVTKYRIETEKDTDICLGLNTLAFGNNWILREIQTEEMSLEEIFFKIVGRAEKGDI